MGCGRWHSESPTGNARTQLQHIKGHQDRTTAFQRLPLLVVQHNVEADELTNKYQRELGTHETNVLMTKWAEAHLILPTGTVTRHYESALRYHASAEPLRTHLRDRNQWSQRTFNTINWTAHGQSIRHIMSNRTHIIKLVHGILPTNSRSGVCALVVEPKKKIGAIL